METLLKRDLWIKFWIVDWVAMTRNMSLKAKGAMIDLWCQAHKYGVPYGYLSSAVAVPFPDAVLARVCNCSLNEFRTVVKELLEANIFARTPEGVCYIPTLVDAEIRRQYQATKGSEGGKKTQQRIAEAKALAEGHPLGSPQGLPQGETKGLPQGHPLSPVASSFQLPASSFLASPSNSDLDFVCASRILAFLNEKAGADFRENPGSLREIAVRVHEVGGDEEAVKKMVARQCACWRNEPRMHRYLRPSTLFDEGHFHEYFGQRDLPVEVAGTENKKVNAGAVNGRIMEVKKRLADLDNVVGPDAAVERVKLTTEMRSLQELQRKATLV